MLIIHNKYKFQENSNIDGGERLWYGPRQKSTPRWYVSSNQIIEAVACDPACYNSAVPVIDAYLWPSFDLLTSTSSSDSSVELGAKLLACSLRVVESVHDTSLAVGYSWVGHVDDSSKRWDLCGSHHIV